MPSERLCRAKHCPTCFSELSHLEAVLNGVGEQRDKLYKEVGAHKKVIDGVVFFWVELKAATAANVPSGDFKEDDNRAERVRVAELNLRLALDRIVPVSVGDRPTCGMEYTVGVNSYSTCSRIQGHSGACGRHTFSG